MYFCVACPARRSANFNDRTATASTKCRGSSFPYLGLRDRIFKGASWTPLVADPCASLLQTLLTVVWRTCQQFSIVHQWHCNDVLICYTTQRAGLHSSLTTDNIKPRLSTKFRELEFCSPDHTPGTNCVQFHILQLLENTLKHTF